MYFPVRPPILLIALLALPAAPDAIDEAELVTRLRPSLAFEVACPAEACAFDAVSDAASFALVAVSAVVEACRKLFRRRRKRPCRATAREAGAADIFAEALE